MVTDVTAAQRAMLELLSGDSYTEARWWDGTRLLAHLYQHHRTAQGVHQTASSLVRRGFAQKQTYNRAVEYRITAQGWEMVNALHSLDKAQRRDVGEAGRYIGERRDD